MFSSNSQTIYEESRPPYEPIPQRQFTNIKKIYLTRKTKEDKENKYCSSFSEYTLKNTPNYQKKCNKYTNEIFSAENNLTINGNKYEDVISESKIIKKLMFEGDVSLSSLSTSKKNLNNNNTENELKNNYNFITFMVKTLTNNMKHFPLETLQILLQEILEDKSNTLKDIFNKALTDLILTKHPSNK